jgi:hypothetical protein
VSTVTLYRGKPTTSPKGRRMLFQLWALAEMDTKESSAKENRDRMSAEIGFLFLIAYLLRLL